jgi:hypothetical protein
VGPTEVVNVDALERKLLDVESSILPKSLTKAMKNLCHQSLLETKVTTHHCYDMSLGLVLTR